MKKIITVCFIVFSVYNVQAQTDTSKKMFWWQLAGGGSLDNADNMKRELNTPTIDPSGNAVKYSNFSKVAGVRVGGACNAIEGMMIGGNLTYDMFLPQTISGFAQISAVRYGGNITFGPFFYYKNILINPFGSVGYAFQTLTIENKSTSKQINFDLDNPVSKGEKRNYTTDYLLFEIGLGIKKSLNKSFAIGVDGGLYFSPSYGGTWKDGSTEVTSRKAPGSSGGFVRLTLAFGRFNK